MWHLSLYEPAELLQIAIELEKGGAAFYKDQAGKTIDLSVRDMFLGFAAEEDKHQADFAALGKDLEEANLRETYPGEYLDYIRSLLETHVFNDLGFLENTVMEKLTQKEVLQVAARLEKDTILFFHSLRRVVKPEKQPLLDRLVAQEEGHLANIARMLREQLKEVVTLNKWRCQECGYSLEAETPPEVCPSCKNKCSFIDNNCYIPDCGMHE